MNADIYHVLSLLPYEDEANPARLLEAIHNHVPLIANRQEFPDYTVYYFHLDRPVGIKPLFIIMTGGLSLDEVNSMLNIIHATLSHEGYSQKPVTSGGIRFEVSHV